MRTEVKYILELVRDNTITIDDGTNRILNLFGVSVSEVDKIKIGDRVMIPSFEGDRIVQK